MALREVSLTAQKAVNDFGGVTANTTARQIVVDITELTIGIIIFQNSPRHFQRVPPFHAIRQEVAVFTRGNQTLGGIQRPVIEHSVMGADDFHPKSLAGFTDCALDGRPLGKTARTVANVLPIGRDFFGKIRRLHQRIIAKNVGIDKGLAGEGVTHKVKNLKAHIIRQRALNVVGGFSVNHHNTVSHFNHYVYLL